MKTSLKTGFAQIFSSCPKNLSCPKFGGAAAPLAPPARTPVGLRSEFLVWVFSKNLCFFVCFLSRMCEQQITTRILNSNEM